MGQLSVEQRRQDWERLGRDHLDLLVVGGGVVGAGVALDAASRGLDVALVEAQDLASGTSSRSSKLVHGGLRYLEMLDVRLVAEALRERALLCDRLAPHLVRTIPFLYPLRHRGWERLYAGTGIALYDLLGTSLGRRSGIPRHRHLSRRGALSVSPGLRPDALVGAIQYWDGQVDDARHTLAVARTAATFGAAVVTRAKVESLRREGDRVVGARVRDLETGAEIEVASRQVVLATGVWTEEAERLAGATASLKVQASKGIHLLFAREAIDSSSGLILRTEKSVLFVIPWGAHWIVGTTDTPWTGDLARPSATRHDVDYLLDQVNRVLRRPLGREDIEAVYVGLRPLVAGRSAETTKLSREHVVSRPAPGLVAIAGGKYTTYRVMAADAVDEAARDLGREVPPSCTASLPLCGAEGYPALWNRRRALASHFGIDQGALERLLSRYGSEIDRVAAAGPLTPIAGGAPYLEAEVFFAVTDEGARHLDDVLARRTRLTMETADRGRSAAPAVARIMAGLLGWDDRQLEAEVEDFLRQRAAEERAEGLLDEAEADEVVRSTPTLLPLP